MFILLVQIVVRGRPPRVGVLKLYGAATYFVMARTVVQNAGRREREEHNIIRGYHRAKIDTLVGTIISAINLYTKLYCNRRTIYYLFLLYFLFMEERC